MKGRLEDFKKLKYCRVDEVFDRKELRMMELYLNVLARTGSMIQDPQCPNSLAIYGDSLFDSQLAQKTSAVSLLVGEELLPTYSYTRLYKKGEELVIHRDRPSCEVSVTTAIAISNGGIISPIYMGNNEDKSGAHKILLEPGQGCIYSGCELYHWREPIECDWMMQTFFHYVRANGPFKDHLFDGRPVLGIQK